jgi:hypothetical protein
MAKQCPAFCTPEVHRLRLSAHALLNACDRAVTELDGPHQYNADDQQQASWRALEILMEAAASAREVGR